MLFNFELSHETQKSYYILICYLKIILCEIKIKQINILFKF
jgi:hypothetical protein